MSEPWSLCCGLLTNKMLSKRNCDKKHTTLLHPPTTNFDERPTTEELVKSGYVGSIIHKASDVLLPILPVKVRANNDRKVVEIYAFLDPSCTAQLQGISLNDNLLQGSDYTNMLLGGLCRFRLESIGIIGDI